MSVSLFRTSLLRSTQVLHGPVRNVSRTLGTVNGNLLVRVVLPSHSVLVRSRKFTTSLAAAAAAAKSASAKKGTTTKGRAVANKKAPAKKAPAKKVPAKKKKVVSKKRVAAKKKPVKAKKSKAPKILKKDWTPPFKKPLSLWAKFANEFTKKMPDGTTLKEGLRAASVEWKNLSAEEKAGYAPLPSDMEEYRRKLAAWNEDLSKNPLLLKAKRKYKRAHKKLRLIPLNANAQFIKEQFHLVDYPPEATTTAFKLRHLAKTFVSEVTEEEKAALKERAIEEFRRKQAVPA